MVDKSANVSGDAPTNLWMRLSDAELAVETRFEPLRNALQHCGPAGDASIEWRS